MLTGMLILLSFAFIAEKDSELVSGSNDEVFLPVLSDYNLYEGNLTDLKPARGTELYEITSHLFVDYAEKQRLIKLPEGSKMIFYGNGLPGFPDGTILVKTFYYYNDKTDPASGKNIIETRLLVKSQSQWKVGTYIWNEQQTEAALITTGTDINVSWKDKDKEIKKVLFHIPSNSECSECHLINEADIPIGPKIMNMNRDVVRDGISINQLSYFQNIGWLDSFEAAAAATLPDYENPDYPLHERARAYLDMNCAHCHSSAGSASFIELFLEYQTPFDSTNIMAQKGEIINRMQSPDMPMPDLGTSVIDAEGFELIKQYINSLD
jgi:uncharacterized repeat protein (TIGR03806 family)